MSGAAKGGARCGGQRFKGLKHYQMHRLQQIDVEINELMFQGDVVTSREVSYQRWMLIHSMMSSCAGLFRQTSCIVQFYK